MTKKMYIWCIVWCWVTAYKYSDRRNNHIIEKIYVHKKLPIICSKLIFRGLLVKLAVKITFEFNSRSFKQGHYGRTTICYFYQHLYGEKEKWYCNTIKIFFRKFVDAIFGRRKLGDNVSFYQWNNCHWKIPVSIQSRGRLLMIPFWFRRPEP